MPRHDGPEFDMTTTTGRAGLAQRLQEKRDHTMPADPTFNRFQVAAQIRRLPGGLRAADRIEHGYTPAEVLAGLGLSPGETSPVAERLLSFIGGDDESDTYPGTDILTNREHNARELARRDGRDWARLTTLTRDGYRRNAPRDHLIIDDDESGDETDQEPGMAPDLLRTAQAALTIAQRHLESVYGLLTAKADAGTLTDDDVADMVAIERVQADRIPALEEAGEMSTTDGMPPRVEQQPTPSPALGSDPGYAVAVDVSGDSLYLFAHQADAEKFAAAVEAGGRSVAITDEPITSTPETLAALIAEQGEPTGCRCPECDSDNLCNRTDDDRRGDWACLDCAAEFDTPTGSDF